MSSDKWCWPTKGQALVKGQGKGAAEERGQGWGRMLPGQEGTQDRGRGQGEEVGGCGVLGRGRRVDERGGRGTITESLAEQEGSRAEAGLGTRWGVGWL